MTPPKLITPAVAMPVSLGDIKAHCRVDFDDDDLLLTGFVLAATAHLDGFRGILGRAIMPQTWQQDFPSWGKLRLALPDVGTVSVVGILDGVETAADSVELLVDGLGAYVVAAGVHADKVRVTYEVALPDDALPVVVMAVKMLVAHWYSNREAVTREGLKETPMAVDRLLGSLRLVSL